MRRVFHMSSGHGCNCLGEFVGLSSRSGSSLLLELFACIFVVTIFSRFFVSFINSTTLFFLVDNLGQCFCPSLKKHIYIFLD